MKTILFTFLLAIVICQSTLGQDDPLSRAASWELPTLESLTNHVGSFLEELQATDDEVDEILQALKSGFESGNDEPLDLVIDAICQARPELNQFREVLRKQKQSNRVPELTSWIEDQSRPSFERDHLRLYFSRWLTQNEFYDEALSHLEQLNVNAVADPGVLLFYRALTQHQLLRQADCLKSLNQLLEQKENLPHRFAILGSLMAADIEPMEEDSLDEIGRLMNDIRRRTGLHRSGKIVRDQEKKVIEKLDKLIEKLEAQQSQQQASNSSSSPMQDSQKAAGTAEGEVNRKAQSDGGDWGDLPPAKRAAALAEMAKDMPPHYRTVIEEYFRKLADEEK